MTANRPQKDLVFIVSGGRTGTTFLGRNLKNVIADCWSEHEPDLFHGLSDLTLRQIEEFGLWHMVFGRLLGQTGVRVLGHRMLIGDVSPEVVRRRIAASRLRYHRRIEQPLIIESNYQFWFLAGDLAAIWPGAKVIGVIRDPRNWVRSWLNHGKRYDDDDKVAALALLPPGRLTPMQLGQNAYAAEWPRWGPFEKLGWEWATIYGHLTRAIDAGGEARMWRFEDLFGPDPAPMATLVAFAADHGERRYPVSDLSAFTRDVANASAGDASAWRDWSPDQARQLDALCGPLMRRWGYGEETEWRALLGQEAVARRA